MYLRHDVDPTIYVTGVPVLPDNCFVTRDISMAQFHKSVTSWYPDTATFSWILSMLHPGSFEAGHHTPLTVH